MKMLMKVLLMCFKFSILWAANLNIIKKTVSLSNGQEWFEVLCQVNLDSYDKHIEYSCSYGLNLISDDGETSGDKLFLNNLITQNWSSGKSKIKELITLWYDKERKIKFKSNDLLKYFIYNQNVRNKKTYFIKYEYFDVEFHLFFSEFIQHFILELDQVIKHSEITEYLMKKYQYYYHIRRFLVPCEFGRILVFEKF